MSRSCIQGGTTARTESIRNICTCSQRTLPGGGRLKPSLPDVTAAAAYHLGPSANGFSHDATNSQHQYTDVCCKAVLVEERAATAGSSITSPVSRVERLQGPTFNEPCYLKNDTVDVAIIGADVAGLAAALATVRACPGARVMIYDTAAGPPVPRDGGALLSVNGRRALRSIDGDLYSRLISQFATSLHESLWYDMEGELVRRTQMGHPPSAAGLLSTNSASTRRRSGPRRTASTTSLTASVASSLTGPNAAPDPAAPPLMVGLHELKEALMEALPPEVLIFGRHHLVCMAPAPGPGGPTQLLFAPTPGGDPVRAVRAQMVVGAEGANSTVRRLQGHSTHHLSPSSTSTSTFNTSAPSHSPSPSGRIVWRGRFTLRDRDPDPARLRRFTTASRTWVDLRAPHGSERQASVAPAGPNLFVWSASCPVELLSARGLSQQGDEGVLAAGNSPYWRCLAMFEDFPQDFFAVLRATADTAVVEYDVSAVQTSAAAASTAVAASDAASLAAPWRWFSGTTALVGESVYPSKADDANCTAFNLALEDAAVMCHTVTQHGLTARALAEYGRLRGPRVSAMLSLPPSAPERLIIRNAPFIPSLAAPTAHSPSAPAHSDITTLATATSLAPDSFASISATGTASASFQLRSADGNEADGKSQPFVEVPVATATNGVIMTSSTNVTLASAATQPPHSSSPQSSITDMSPTTAAVNHSVLQPPKTATETTVTTAGSATTSQTPTDPTLDAIPTIMPYTADGSPSWVWSTLLDVSGDASSRLHEDTEGAGAAAAAVPLTSDTTNSAAASHPSPSPPPSPSRYNSSSSATMPESFGDPSSPSDVAPDATGGDTLVTLSYDATLSPSMVWSVLLWDSTATAAVMVETPSLGASPGSGSDSATASDTMDVRERSEQRQSTATLTPAAISANSSSSTTSNITIAAAAVPGALTREPTQGLLPRPVPRLKQPGATSTLTAVAPSTTPQPPIAANTSAGADAGLAVAPTAAVPLAAANSTSATRNPRAGGGGPLRRRNGTHRGTHAGVVAGSTTITTTHHKSKQRTAHSGNGNFNVNGSNGGGGGRARTTTAAIAASAAAQMTVSLNAAAALGGVLSASGADGSHAATAVPELAKALGMHSGAAVAQFWEDLNNLALSSASSLSSLDLP